MNELKELLIGYEQAHSIVVVLINFFYCIVSGFILRYFFLRYSTLLVAHNHIANILPMLSAIVFFVILIVKSSIALSLGLVGALSIVRFRTPIKEPEELIYLFYAIAIGLGFGSGQSGLTIIILISSLLIFGFIYSRVSNKKHNEFNLSINWNRDEASVEDMSSKIAVFSDNYKIVKISIDSNNEVYALILFESLSDQSIDNILNEIKSIAPSSSLSVHEQLVNW